MAESPVQRGFLVRHEQGRAAFAALAAACTMSHPSPPHQAADCHGVDVAQLIEPAAESRGGHELDRVAHSRHDKPVDLKDER